MVKNRNLKLISDVEDLLSENFPEGWMDLLDWSNEEKSKASFFEGQKKIEELENSLFVLFSKTIIQGDHLRFSSSGIDGLLNKCTCDMVSDANKSRTSLLNRYQQTLKDLRSAILLAKFHFEISSGFFSPSDTSRQINIIEFEQPYRNEKSWVSILDTIVDVCMFEYRFSYDQNKIRDLLVCREHLLKSKKILSDKSVLQCIDGAISKVNMSLLKLSHFTKDKRIEYKFNFVSTVVDPAKMNSLSTEEYSNYLKFIDPESYITGADAFKWQTHVGKKWARLGQMVLLMRYYTKVTKNPKQAQNLLSEYEAFYKEKNNSVFYDFNKYALRSVRVYMYNCLFSLKCKNPDKFDFDAIKSNLEDINAVQDECMIHNYHPYKKAVEYAVHSITNDMKAKVEKVMLQKKFELLKSWQSLYRENIDWCCQNQRYAFQLTFRECTEVGNDYKIFHPSSFSRPLKFKEIYKKCGEIDLKISMLENELAKYDEILSIKEAQEKISNMERKNMEHMGLFVTITTFLVGLLSIFIGNNGQVSIVEKMRYVLALGLVLVVFVCLGYFVVRGKDSKLRSCVFGFLIGISTASILGICWIPSGSNNHYREAMSEASEQKQVYSVDGEQDQTILKANTTKREGK